MSSWIKICIKFIRSCVLIIYYDLIDSMQLMGMSDRAQIPSIFSHRSSFGTPTYSIVLCVIVIASVLPLQFGLIIELTNFAYCMGVTLEFISFIKLQVLGGGKCSIFVPVTTPLYLTLAFDLFLLSTRPSCIEKDIIRYYDDPCIDNKYASIITSLLCNLYLRSNSDFYWGATDQWRINQVVSQKS